MKRNYLIILPITLAVGGIIAYLVILGVNRFSSDDIQQPVITPIPTSQPSPSPTPEEEAELPRDWTNLYDAGLQIKMSYPVDWTPRPATNTQGESAVYSYNPEEVAGTDPVPEDKLKIGIVYFGPNDQREITYDEGEIISEEEITVDGYSAIRREISGDLGENIATEVNLGESQYLISAYPLDSQLIATYNQFLDFVDLEADIPVEIISPELGMEIGPPVSVQGQASGTWFFEAILPISVTNVEGSVLAEDLIMTEEDWMTEEMIAFEKELDFEAPDANFGFIKISKNDPSGIPRNANDYYWPIEF